MQHDPSAIIAVTAAAMACASGAFAIIGDLASREIASHAGFRRYRTAHQLRELRVTRFMSRALSLACALATCVLAYVLTH